MGTSEGQGAERKGQAGMLRRDIWRREEQGDRKGGEIRIAREGLRGDSDREQDIKQATSSYRKCPARVPGWLLMRALRIACTMLLLVWHQHV